MVFSKVTIVWQPGVISSNHIQQLFFEAFLQVIRSVCVCLCENLPISAEQTVTDSIEMRGARILPRLPRTHTFNSPPSCTGHASPQTSQPFAQDRDVFTRLPDPCHFLAWFIRPDQHP